MKKSRFTPKVMAILSILLALEVIIARFGTIRPSESIKLSLDFIPIVIAAILYGTVPAVVMSILADILGAFLFPVGPFFPGFTPHPISKPSANAFKSTARISQKRISPRSRNGYEALPIEWRTIRVSLSS